MNCELGSGRGHDVRTLPRLYPEGDPAQESNHRRRHQLGPRSGANHLKSRLWNEGGGIRDTY